jgi:Concanavalin A-like lectin/glucanases superfamily
MGGTGGSSDLVLRYTFDETSGSVVHDTSAGAAGAHDGALAMAGSGGSATFTTNKAVGTGALALQGQGNSAGGYVTTSSLTALAPNAVTLAVWINVPGGGANQRAFDFGIGTNKYIFLTPNDGMNRVRFAITANGRGGEQEIHASTWTMSTPSWHHVAVVLPAGSSYSGTLYIDGVAAANNTAMSVHLSDLGETTGNYLGRSAFAADDYFNGALDDFRVYRRALSASEIAALYGAHE